MISFSLINPIFTTKADYSINEIPPSTDQHTIINICKPLHREISVCIERNIIEQIEYKGISAILLKNRLWIKDVSCRLGHFGTI